MLEKEKTNKILSPCLLYTGAVVCSLIFSSIFSQRMKTPAYIINDVISSLEEINKKIERNTMIIAKDTSHQEINQIKNELVLVRDRITDIKMRIKNKTWAN